jgi:hypothetical protein
MANLFEKAQGQAGIERPEDEKVMISCRAKSSKDGIERVCPGTQAQVLVKQKLGTGGRLITYKCLTCKVPFQINF